MTLKITTAWLLSLLTAYNLSAQDTAIKKPDCIDISRVALTQRMDDNFSSAYINPGTSLADQYDSLAFTKGAFHKNRIPINYVTKRLIIRFAICNTADTSSSIWLF